MPDSEVRMSGAGESVVVVAGPSLERQVAASALSVGRNLRSFAVALLLVALVMLLSCVVGLLIAETFYGYGGLG
jgi:hypothetical protein